jgi:hypothetical protein
MDELVQRLLDDQIEPDEMQRLGKAIREDPRVRDYYVDSLLVSAVIRRSSQVTGELSKSDLIQALSGRGRLVSNAAWGVLSMARPPCWARSWCLSPCSVIRPGARQPGRRV